MIYLDNSAATIPDEEVLKTFTKASSAYFGNPSSLHKLGGEASALLEKAREKAAELLEAEQHQVLFTSGATESNNLAVQGTAYARQNRGKHVVVSSLEHPSILEAVAYLEREGWDVTRVSPQMNGDVTAQSVKRALREDTVLVCMMHVNNETGAILPAEEVGLMLKRYPRIHYHVDAVQAVGKIPVSFRTIGADSLSISAHKIHGLKGTGLLVYRDTRNLTPLFFGGAQESGIRAGTENPAGAAAAVKALRLAVSNRPEHAAHMRDLNVQLETFFKERKEVVINSPAQRAPHIINVSCPGRKAETVVHALEQREIYISTTSACSSRVSNESSVLKEMGADQSVAESAVRISLSGRTTAEEIGSFMKAWEQTVPEVTLAKGAK
ncbi:cysteine desulfurase family protein [Alkalicoccus luteus]|uniref:Cysteine desulfurase n=1 Tax=Alkalicoccus luteus TaxID=1237094 RepID=A0A969TU54_9BACI|nr:cysteine desulfurase family protein [Alkalicoccus luteus]NJP36985.1 cysteine desulfurase [Alkalicoccus luteus]